VKGQWSGRRLTGPGSAALAALWPHKDAQYCHLLHISEYRFSRSATKWAGSGHARHSLRIRCFRPSGTQWKIVQRPDSKRNGRALSAPLGNLPEVLRYIGNGIVLAADDEAEDTSEGWVRLDARGSLTERRGDFTAQCAVIGQKIHPGMA
jgi:hypothetical protein